MIITLTPDIESGITEQAQREGTKAERLALDSLQQVFVAPQPTMKLI